MAIFHLSIKVISRGKGKSAVAAAAYRAGERIKSSYDGVEHDYTRKGGIAHTEILLPANAPPEYAERTVLWNAVEKIEKAKNAQLAREVEIALPAELTRGQYISLAREYAQRQFVDKGMCADVCIHDKNDGNPHAHIMLTMRPFSKEKTWGARQRKEYTLDKNGNRIYDPKKRQYKCASVPSTDWNEHHKAEEWRAAWAEAANTTLERHGFGVRIDHRSFERLGKEEIPTVHLGVSAAQMERKGIITDRGGINREAKRVNAALRKLQSRIDELKSWMQAETKKGEPVYLVHIVQRVLARQEEKRKSSRYPAQIETGIFVEMLDFLHEHGIKTMDDFKEKAAGLHNRREVQEFERMRFRLEQLIRQEKHGTQVQKAQPRRVQERER